MFDKDSDKSSMARMLVKRLVTTELYPTDTPLFLVNVIATQSAKDHPEDIQLNNGGRIRVWLETTLPDGMLYSVSWGYVDSEPVLKAYKQIHLEELRPH